MINGGIKMSILSHKIDFIALAAVGHANPNGDPLDGNRPRTVYSGLGEMSDVCIKRKIRNRMQDLGYEIFVKSDDRCDDGYPTLKDRAEQALGKVDAKAMKNKDAKDAYVKKACAKWLDVRSFGQIFPFKPEKGSGDKGVSIAVRGPVSIHQAFSISPVEVESLQITKSVNADPGDEKGSNRMGSKHMVAFGLYEIKGAINVQLAEKTGFSEEDAEVIKECLRTLFVNDASAARPEGSMYVHKLFWWKHANKSGQYSSAKVHGSLKIKLKDSNHAPMSPDDYTYMLEELPGLKPEVLDGV